MTPPVAPQLATQAGEAPGAWARMPLRHKLMLLAAFEIVVAGVTLADMRPYRVGVTVEAPVQPGHVIV